MTPLERAVRDFIDDWNKRMSEGANDPLEAEGYWELVALVRDRIPQAAGASLEDVRRALAVTGYLVQPVADRLFRLR